MTYSNKSKRGIFIVVIFMSCIILNSCNDDEFFELKSPPALAWKSVKEMELGIASVYTSFVNPRGPHISVEHDVWNMDPFIHFGMSDIVRQITINGGWNSDQLYNRATSNYFWRNNNNYFQNYRTILLTNKLLDYIATNPFPDANKNEKMNIDRIKGEALFIRAMAYYHLLTWYGKPYDPNGSNDQKILSLRLSVPVTIEMAMDNTPVENRVVYEQVVNDLKDASQLLPLKWQEGMHEAYKYGRASKHAAQAALARVYCLMGRYTDALTELNAVLDDTQLSRALEPDPENNWLNNSATEPWTSSEIIWYAFYADIEAMNSYIEHQLKIYAFFVNSIYFTPTVTQSWWMWSLNRETQIKCGMTDPVDNSVTDAWKFDKRAKLFNRFGGYDPKINPARARKDQRVDMLYGADYKGFVELDDPAFISSKYYRVPKRENVGIEPSQNIPIIRSAELYLWRAALKQVTGIGGQAADINLIRQRSWMAEGLGAYVPLSDAETTWEVIDNEWVKEMAFEGDRVIWLQMFKKPIGPGNRDVPDVLPPHYEGMQWPIPLEELDFQ